MAERREYPAWDAHHDGERERHDPELERDADAVRDDVVHAAGARPIGRPAGAGNESTGPLDVLLVQGLVESVLRVEPGLDARGKSLLGIPRTARNGVHEEERDDRDREQHRDDPQDPPSEITDHGLTSFVLDPYAFGR